MPLPPRVVYATVDEYRQHFQRVYCRGPVMTFDGIPVAFNRSDFDHCMYESSRRDRNKDQFSVRRSERIDWIRETLTNPKADLYQGWDKSKKRCDPASRVAVVYEEFVVVIRIYSGCSGGMRARFLTAYLADNSIAKIRAMPRWVKK